MTRRALSEAIAHLMPYIIRGVHLDFFVKTGVTQMQFLVLMAIHASGRCTMGTLARTMHVRMPTATGIVDRLVKAHFVHRMPMPDDRRQVVVELTRRGEAFIRQFQAVVSRRWDEILFTLSAKELEAFGGVVTKLHAQLHPS